MGTVDTCLSAEFSRAKAQFFSDLIYMKEKRCSMARVSHNLQVLSLQGKVIFLRANVMELQGRYIPSPMLSPTSFIRLDKQCLISFMVTCRLLHTK